MNKTNFIPLKKRQRGDEQLDWPDFWNNEESTIKFRPHKEPFLSCGRVPKISLKTHRQVGSKKIDHE